MDNIEEILTNKKYRKEIEELDSETVKQIADNPMKALEAARNGIAMEEPNKANDIAYLQSIADAMQQVARIFVKKG